MFRVASSRRATGLKPTDYDHEISLVDHDAARTPPTAETPEPLEISRTNTTSRLLDLPENSQQEDHVPSSQPPKPDDTQEEDDGRNTGHVNPQTQNQDQPAPEPRPTAEIQHTTPHISQADLSQIRRSRSRRRRESAIDILYENERGGFLCGIALFSGQALGGLDPPAWTNTYHNASPTNIHNAQVPDPSWEWAWPDWRINMQDGVDEGGWEYAFAFSKCCSWHRARWWNSFVRRRAWTRKRVTKKEEDISVDPHMLSSDYFLVRPAADRLHHSRESVNIEQHVSRRSWSQTSVLEDGEMPDIENIENLMQILRHARIDREKLEAVENYLDHALDLSQLQDEMHEIMSIFVFQASRRILLSRLMQIHDETTEKLRKNDTPELKARHEAIKDAVKHADEEVRKLAYWSDVKQMAENGETKHAVNPEKGWTDKWRGLDQSGGAHPKEDDAWRYPPTATSNNKNPHLQTASRTGESLRGYEKQEQAPNRKSKALRKAYRIKAALVDEHERKAHYPVTGKPRKYPTDFGTNATFQEHQQDVIRQVGHAIIWNQFYKKPANWKDSLELLRRTTPKESERPEMSAVRIVLPKTLTVGVMNSKLAYVDSVTGVLQRLRASPDKDPSSIILRGKNVTLSKAIEDIVRYCKEAQVYELGNVSASDYKTKQLWPAIEVEPSNGSSSTEDHKESIWLHKEYEPFNIERPYEETPKPQKWTRENFETYIATLCYGRVPAHLAIKLYGERRENGRYIDTEGIRISLIVSAFEDPEAQQFITAPVLKMALSLMASKGGHQARANKLFRLGEKLGIPVDTDTFNIMLQGYVDKRDPAFFYSFLRKMEASYFQPNVTTWLLFLRLIKGESERKQIVVAMYELGMLQYAATRRGIADIMAPVDAYAALRAGKTLDGFLADQKERYGKDWLSTGAINGIITELLRFHRDEDPRVEDCKRLIDIQAEAGLQLDIDTINIFLRHAAARRDWKTALWTMSLFKQAQCEPDADSYASLIALAIKTRAPHALGTIYFYGVLNRKLKKASRELLSQILLRIHPDEFWQTPECQPNIFPNDVVSDIQNNKIARPRQVMSHIERAILDKWDGFGPVKPLAYALTVAYQTNDMAFHRHNRNASSNEDAAQKRFQMQEIAIKIRRLDGVPGTTHVRLTRRFEPSLMLQEQAQKMDEPVVQEPSREEETSSDAQSHPTTSTCEESTTQNLRQQMFGDVLSETKDSPSG
ncbi:hypothetical protein BGZ63DRAFT_498569 [Mariannaea sp. PMI_226]|nr:hypothetical protein BGZ63DRAFT_498569 [Mariannaea sp. PMI_226]